MLFKEANGHIHTCHLRLSLKTTKETFLKQWLVKNCGPEQIEAVILEMEVIVSMFLP